MKLIPKNSKVKLTFYKGITITDVIIGFIGLILVAICSSSNLPFKFSIVIIIISIFIILFIPISEDRLYKTIYYLLKHLLSKKNYSKEEVGGIIPYDSILGCNLVKNKDSTYFGVIKIVPVDLQMMNEFKEEEITSTLYRIFTQIGVSQEIDIIKVECPLILDSFIKDDIERIKNLIEAMENKKFSEEEYQARLDIIQNRMELIDEINSNKNVFHSTYYLVIHGHEIQETCNLINRCKVILQANNVQTHQLDKIELVKFLRYTFDDEFDEREDISFSKELIPSSIDFKLINLQQNQKTLTKFVINKYPLKVGNCWLEGLFDMPNTKVIMKMRPVEKSKALKRIDNAIVELSSQQHNLKASNLIDRETHLESLQELLVSLQTDNEDLFDTTIIITIYDELGKNINKKKVRRRLKEMGFGYNEMIGRQLDAYLTSNISMMDKINISRGISSKVLAASFPFVSNAIIDENGILLGENQLPTFVNFFKRNNEYLNSNMIVIGKPGSGKSFATKSILTQLASENTRVFILDPENEYTNLASKLYGKVLDVSSAEHGIINPFQVIISEHDEVSHNDYFAHLQFLEEFYRIVLAGISSDCLELLNQLTQELYIKFKMDSTKDFRKFKPSDYPTFEDLANFIENSDRQDEYMTACLRTLKSYLSKFKKGGRYSNLWNGYTSFKPQENFVVFNFQKLFSNKNTIVANAQMLLVLKWLENEVIKNKDENEKSKTKKRIVVAIDEAHLFIDEKFPVALDFMYQMAKRIRKYEGMFIIITQNVKDFAGTPEIARKSMAIINVSQYSLIFSLSPNDMTDLCKLYENAGQINDIEKEAIIHNSRGTAFLISSASRRTNINIIVPKNIEKLF